MFWDSFSESDLGNSDNFQSSIKSKDHLDLTKQENSDTRESKDMFSTESELEEVEERSQLARVLFTESPLIKVLTSWSPQDPIELLLKKELEEDAKISES